MTRCLRRIFDHFSRRPLRRRPRVAGAWLAALVALLPAVAQGGGEDGLLTEAEARALPTINAMWRLIDVRTDAARNLALLRQQGFDDESVGLIRPQLLILWDVDPQRNIGWLDPDRQAEIRRIDREFGARMRAARRWRAVGIPTPGVPPLDVRALDRAWHRAILAALDYREIREFGQTNSAAARRIYQEAAAAGLTAIEARQIVDWHRALEGEFSAQFLPSRSAKSLELQEARLQYWENLRTLLGEARAAGYLAGTSAAFTEWRAPLLGLPQVGDGEIFRLFLLRQKSDLRAAQGPGRTASFYEEQQAAAVALLGPEKFEALRANPALAWLFPRPRRVVRMAPQPREASAGSK